MSIVKLIQKLKHQESPLMFKQLLLKHLKIRRTKKKKNV